MSKLIAYIGRNHVGGFKGGGIDILEISEDGSSITPLPAAPWTCRSGRATSPTRPRRGSSTRSTSGRPTDAAPRSRRPR